MSEKHKWTEGIGARIKSIRYDARLDQGAFAKSIGVTRQSISAYETERLMPSRNVVERMADIYGASPWWLLYGVTTEDSLDSEGLLIAKGENRAAKLTNAQRMLFEFILENQPAAEQLALDMFNKALSLQ